MTQTPTRLSLFDICWFLFFAMASSVWCLGAASQLGPTWDEPTYINAGLSHWRTRSVHGIVAHGTMPLPVDLQTFPLYLYECWRGTPIGFLKDPFCLFVARAGNLVFWWILLFFGWRIARDLAVLGAAALPLPCSPVSRRCWPMHPWRRRIYPWPHV